MGNGIPIPFPIAGCRFIDTRFFPCRRARDRAGPAVSSVDNFVNKLFEV